MKGARTFRKADFLNIVIRAPCFGGFEMINIFISPVDQKTNVTEENSQFHLHVTVGLYEGWSRRGPVGLS